MERDCDLGNRLLWSFDTEASRADQAEYRKVVNPREAQELPVDGLDGKLDKLLINPAPPHST